MREIRAVEEGVFGWDLGDRLKFGVGTGDAKKVLAAQTIRMKPNHARPRTGGFSGWDALVVAVTVFLAIGFVLPKLTRAGRPSSRLSCANNLKQVGLAFRMWSNDNSERFPWIVGFSPTNSGTRSYAASTNVWRHFQIISNEVNTPKVFVCPEDRARTKVATWDVFTNNNHLSYFVGLDANEVLPQTILTGDRNLAISNRMLSGVVALPAGAALAWTKEMHETEGNVGLADGSAMQINNAGLNRQFQAAFQQITGSVFRLSFPQ